MNYRYGFQIFILVFSFAFTNAIGQVLETKSLTKERGYEAIEIKFDVTNLDSLPTSGIPTSQLFLYGYYSGQGWQPIPFQIDEKDAFVPSNNVIDTTDVLIFLAKDLGDKVDRKAWIANPASQTNKRYEIEIVDPLDRSKKGWCYLFISATLSEQDKSPTKYVEVDTMNDIITSPFYKIEYNSRWYPQSIAITTAGQGNNQNFYDRTKLRFIMNVLIGNWLVLNEDNLVLDPDSTIKKTPKPVVRYRRSLPLKAIIYGQPYGKPFTFTMTYYPYSNVFSGDVDLNTLSGGLVKIKCVRMSYDLNSNITNMKFFGGDSAGIKNQNIIIDGSGYLDNVDTSVAKNKKNWTMVTGTPGTMLTINEVRYENNPSITPEPYAQYLYYWDDGSDSVLTGSEYPAEIDKDTLGLPGSYGDHGMFYESYALTGSLHYLSTTYFIGANQSGTVAQNMFKNFNEPILSLVYVTEQKYSTGIDTKDYGELPDDYRLSPIFPNPFNPTTNITFNLPKNDHVNLQIFDLKGRQIITLVNKNLNAGMHHYTWDGRDGNGKLVSSGIYICVVKTPTFQASQKMAFVK